MPAIALAAALSLSGPPSRLQVAQAAAEARAAAAAAEAHTWAQDGFRLDNAPGSPALLEARWAAVRRWASAWIGQNGLRSTDRITAAAQRDLGLDVSATLLDPASVLVSAQADAFGTAFILRRTHGGRLVTAMAVNEPGSWGGGGPPELAAWRSDRARDDCRAHRPDAEWDQCGPLAPAAAVRLADEADGARRFAIIGVYAQEMGATQGFLVSVWRWNGRRARPLLGLTLAQMADDPVFVRAAPDRLVVHAKDEFKRMFACGACSGRQVELPILLPAQGARLGPKRSLVPDLDLVDELYDRLFRSQPTAALADPAVRAKLGPVMKDSQDRARKAQFDPTIGMIMGWKVSAKAAGTTLCLETDEAGARLFDIEARGGRRRVTAVRPAALDACSGPGSRF